MTVRNEIVVIDSVRPGLAAMRAQIQNANRRGAQVGGRIVRDIWRRGISGPGNERRIGVRTGERMRSIVYRTEAIPGGWSATIGPRGSRNAMILAAHEFGAQTAPHVIRPRRAKVLSWIGRGGVRAFAKFVNHPGSKIPRRPHRAPALKAARGPLRLAFRGNYERALAEARRIGLARPTTLTYSEARFGPGGQMPRMEVKHSPEVIAASGALAALLGGNE